jgi:hypothetical protein
MLNGERGLTLPERRRVQQRVAADFGEDIRGRAARMLDEGALSSDQPE